MFSHVYILSTTKYTSHITNKIHQLVLKTKQTPIIKIKNTIFECHKYDFVTYKEKIYKISKKTYLGIAQDIFIDHQMLKISNVYNIPSTIKYLIKFPCPLFLNLEYNFFTRIPKSIFKLSNIQYLRFFENQITHISKSISKLSDLKYLYLYDNHLIHIPKSIGNLSNLSILMISSDKLKKVPESIGNLSNLQEFGIVNTLLRNIPKSICKLCNLQKLNLSQNRLISIPTSIGNLTNLEYLYLSDNQIKDIPTSISNLFNLKILYLLRNKLDLKTKRDISKIFKTKSNVCVKLYDKIIKS